MRVAVARIDGGMWLAQSVRWSSRAIILAFAVGALSACGDAHPRTPHFGTYVSDVCEAIGPFERDAQRLGRMLGVYGPDAKSRSSERSLADILTAVISDSRHVVATLDPVGAPDINNGRKLAAGMIATFDQIARSDVAWRSELRAGLWAGPTTSRAARERLHTSVEALMLVGRQIERLPHTRERQSAMASSRVCRDLFGSIRVGGQAEGDLSS